MCACRAASPDTVTAEDWTKWGIADEDCLLIAAPMGLKNRCRIRKIIRGIERLDWNEAEDPTIVEDSELMGPHRLTLSPR